MEHKPPITPLDEGAGGLCCSSCVVPNETTPVAVVRNAIVNREWFVVAVGSAGKKNEVERLVKLCPTPRPGSSRASSP